MVLSHDLGLRSRAVEASVSAVGVLDKAVGVLDALSRGPLALAALSAATALARAGGPSHWRRRPCRERPRTDRPGRWWHTAWCALTARPVSGWGCAWLVWA